MEDTKVLTFNLQQTDIDIIGKATSAMTRPNRSEALRKILREWSFFAEQRRLAERPEALAFPAGPVGKRERA